MSFLLSGCSSNQSDSDPTASTATAPVSPTVTAGSEPTSGAANPSAPAVAGAYDLGTFIGTDIWVDPVNGNDRNDGHDRASAMRTVDEAWGRIPAGQELTTGYRLRLAAGDYPQATSVNYWEDRHGTAAAPIIVEAADGPHTATFEGDINMFGVSHFALIGIDIIREADAFHCEQCDHILLRDTELSGGTGGTGAHETVKVNQSQYIYIESSDIHGAEDNAIDFVAVQHGHVIGNRIHDALDWCAYAKGGSASITFANNEVYDCGTGGITAGQGTGFEFMSAPWLNYEAYGIVIVGNVVHDTEGAGLGVAGGFNILLAYNTLYDVGARSHVVEFVHGRRGCDGSLDVCQAHHDAGGWGSTGGEEALIPNRHIFFVDNLILNPAGHASQWQHLQIDGPLDVPSSSGVPSPSWADDDLRIEGNVIWNGPADHVLGTGDGCPDANDTCSAALITAANSINTLEPELRDPEHGDFRLADTSAAAMPRVVALPEFVWDATPVAVPVGDAERDISTDIHGNPRATSGPPGAG